MKKLVLAIMIGFSLSSCNKEEESHTVHERILNEAVYASGEILPEEYEFLNTGTSERILKIFVEEGDTVKKGDVLAILGTPSENNQLSLLSDQVALARQNAKESEAYLSELRGKIQLAHLKYLQDSSNAERYNDLVQDKAVSQKEADQANLQAETSSTEHFSLRQKYQSLRLELTNKLLQAEQELARLKQSQEGKVLISNFDGKIYGLNIQEGELAHPQEPIVMVGSTDKFKLELLVDERDINKIKLGQKVYFETDAFADKQFEGEIVKIVPILQKENRSFKVEARVLDMESFYPQSSVEANIMIRENVGVLVVPTDYLLEGDSVHLQGNEGKKVKVIPGTRNGDWIEVKNGINAGDIITKSN